MVKTHRLAGTTSTSVRKSFSTDAKSFPMDVANYTPETCKSALADALKLEMANAFLDFNLQNVIHLLECIKHSQTFNFKRVTQEIYPAPPAPQCKMSIEFINNRKEIRVSISYDQPTMINNKTRRIKKYSKLIDIIEYLEEIYQEL